MSENEQCERKPCGGLAAFTVIKTGLTPSRRQRAERFLRRLFARRAAFWFRTRQLRSPASYAELVVARRARVAHDVADAILHRPPHWFPAPAHTGRRRRIGRWMRRLWLHFLVWRRRRQPRSSRAALAMADLILAVQEPMPCPFTEEKVREDIEAMRACSEMIPPTPHHSRLARAWRRVWRRAWRLFHA